MKYIKSVEEFNSINEELNIKGIWKEYKSYLIAIGLIAGVSNYTNIKATLGFELNQSEISKIVNDIEYEPEGDNKKMVDDIRKKLIAYVKYNDKIEESRKPKLIKDIQDIRISIPPKRFANAIGRSKVIGVHFVYIDYPTNVVKNAVVLNADFFEDGFFSKSDNDLKITTTIHELFHFIDFKLNQKEKMGYYSDVLDLSTLLDMDIVTGNPSGKKKLSDKIYKFIKLQGGEGMSDAKLKHHHDQMMSILDGNMKYISDPAEVFARYHGLKMWMYDYGMIESPNDSISKDDIIEIMSKYNLIDMYKKQQIDFFELLFLMKIDFDKEVKDDESLKGFNSMVANYKDFDNKKRDV